MATMEHAPASSALAAIVELLTPLTADDRRRVMAAIGAYFQDDRKRRRS